MADQYINETGLQVIKTWIKSTFGLKSDLETLTSRVDDIVAEGGEPNVIETVKVNGTALTPDAQKAVNLNGATQEQVTRWYIRDYSDDAKILEIGTTNDGVNILSTSNGFDQNDWVKNLVDKNYVDANGGKIDKIKVNGTEQTITNKEVDIAVPTKTSDITNDSNFQTETQVQALIDAELTSVYKPGGTVEFASLPPLAKENVGFIYDVIDGFTTTADFVEGAGKVYPAHTNVGIIDKGPAGYFYDVFSGMVDLTNYWTSSAGQSNTLQAMTVSEINAILNA